MLPTDDAAQATPPPGDLDAGAGAETSKSWEKLDIDQVRRGDDGAVSRRLTGTRVVPLAGGLAGMVALGALAGALRRLTARRGR